MYYTLQATRADDDFRLWYVEEGPERWEVEVARRGANAGAGRSEENPTITADV